jgi:hypothetical protein
MSVNSAPDATPSSSQVSSVACAPVGQHLAGAPVQATAVFSSEKTQVICAIEQESSMGIAEQKIQIGLQSEDGSFIDFSKKLPRKNSDNSINKDYTDLVALANKYSRGKPNFAINLSALKDGDGNVLVPLDDNIEAFEQDMTRLREIAKKTLGIETWHWNSYPHGYRAIVGNTKALDTGHSARLKEEFDFDTNDLKKWLDEIKAEEFTPDENDASNVQETKRNAWEGNKEERMIQAVKGFHAGINLMSASRAAVTKEIEQLQEDAKAGRPVPGLGARIQKLRKMLATLPYGQIPKDAAEAKEARRSGQTTRMAAILYAASHLHYGDEKPDLQKMSEDAQKHIDRFSKPNKDCSGTFSRFKTSHYAELLPDNKATEKNFLNCVKLLSLNIPEGDRRKFEHYRQELGAEPRSDGPELFFVGAVSAVVANQKISVNGSASDIAFGEESVIKAKVGQVALATSEAQSNKRRPPKEVIHNSAALIAYYNIPIA